MKRKKRLIILAGTLAVLCIGIFITKTAVEHVEKVNTVDEEILTVDPETASEITMDIGTEVLKLEKTDGVWKDSEDADYPIDSEQVENFLESFESVHASFAITDVEDYAQYGLENPTAALYITCGDETKTLFFGTFSTMDNKRYVMTEEGAGKVYLIDEDLEEKLTTDRDEIIDRDTLYAYDQVTALDVTLQADEDAVLEAEKKNEEADEEDKVTVLPVKDETVTIKYLPDEEHSYNSDEWDYYNVQGTNYQPVDEDLLTTWLNNLTSMNLDSYATYKASDEDVTKYGLDDPDLKITVTGTMDDEDSEAPDSYTVAIKKKSDSEIYVRVDDSKIIFKIDSDTYNSIAKCAYNDLRPKNVLTLNWKNVDAVSMTVGSDSYSVGITHTSGTDDDVYKMNDKTIDLSSVITNINDLKMNDFDMINKEEDVEKALEKDPELSFTLTLNNKDYKEQKVDIYQFDGDNCVVCLNGETLGLMSRSLMADLKESMVSAALNIK